jgi:hypothetical protein
MFVLGFLFGYIRDGLASLPAVDPLKLIEAFKSASSSGIGSFGYLKFLLTSLFENFYSISF